MLVKSANLTFRQIVKSANREGGEHDRTHNLMLQAKKQRTGYALRFTHYAHETFSHSTTHLKFRLTCKVFGTHLRSLDGDFFFLLQ
jgi:hypothetical protein